jgi:hypothetical protein
MIIIKDNKISKIIEHPDKVVFFLKNKTITVKVSTLKVNIVFLLIKIHVYKSLLTYQQQNNLWLIINNQATI